MVASSGSLLSSCWECSGVSGGCVIIRVALERSPKAVGRERVGVKVPRV